MRKEYRKRAVSALLVLVMLVSMLPLQAFSAAADARGTGSYIGFTNDMHDQTGKLTSWIIGVQNDVEPDLEYMAFGGDFTYEKSIVSFNKAVSIVNQLIGRNRGIYTTGNHDYDDTVVAKQMVNTPGFLRIGLAVDAVNYDIYCIGAAGSGTGTFGTFSKEDLAQLEAYLKTAPKDEPIFLVTHWPLHYFGGRTTTGASEMIDLLNGYPNVVFLWGHNHSQDDTHYGEILTAGDYISYQRGRAKEIAFTYASAGAMRGDRPPYYGLVANVSSGGNTVTLTYYGADGVRTNVSRTVRISAGTAAPEPDRPGTVVVTGVSLDQTAITMTAGEQAVLTASVVPANAANKAVTWNSSNPSVATVSGGVITARAAGTATITATAEDGGKTAACSVTVNPAQVAVTGVSLNKTGAMLTVGGQTTLTAAVTPSDATNKTVRWTSNNESVATVAEGVVTAKTPGTAIITATTAEGGKSAKCTVTVQSADTAVTGVALSQTRISLTAGGYAHLRAAVLPSSAANKTVTWSSDRPDIAVVENGIVRAVAAGNTVIRVATEDGGFTAECDVTVHNGEENHRHEPVFADRTEATCTETGMEAYWFCNGCDLYFGDGDCTILMTPEDLILDRIPHIEKTVDGIPAACTEDGLTEGVICAVCETILESQKVMDALGHREEIDAAVAPTCTEDGLTEGLHCSVCKTVLEEQKEIPRLGHQLLQSEGDCLCAVCGFEMYLRLPQTHISLYLNQKHRMQAEAYPADLAEDIRWSLEKGGEEVLHIDAQGNVTTLGVGTAYVVASVTDGDITMTERCRVDVCESVEPEGIRLSTRTLAAELYSTDYPVFDVLLQMPQNYPENADAAFREAAMAAADNGIAVDSARFADETMAKLFRLTVLDDRRVQVIPTDYAVENPTEVKGKHIGSVIVTVRGRAYESEELTLTVKKTMPKLKAAVASFNSFYSGDARKITVTGGTPVQILADTSKAMPIPQWLTLQDGVLTLTEDAPLKNLSGKVFLRVYTEEWRIPVAMAVAVKNTYKAPGLKLSATAVTLTALTEYSDGVELKLLPKNAKDTLKSLNVTGIAAPQDYSITNFSREAGTFTLKAKEGFRTGKISLNVIFSDTKVTIPLVLTVKTAPVTLVPSVKNLTLNTALKDTARITLRATPSDYRITDPDFRLTDSKGADKAGELDIRYEDGSFLVSTTKATPSRASYLLRIRADGSKEAVVAIKTVAAKPGLTLKAKGVLNLSFPDRAVEVTPVFKNYNGNFGVSAMTVETVGKENVTGQFRAEQNGKTIRIRCAADTPTGTYTVKLKLTLADGSSCESSIKVSVKRSPVMLKLSANKLTLNKTIQEAAFVDVTCLTPGYAFREPVVLLRDKTGKVSAEGMLDIRYAAGTLKVAVNGSTQYGAVYKLLVKANAAAPAVTLTVTIPSQSKSVVTAGVKTGGSVDVVRDSTAVRVTPGYSNVKAGTEKQETLVFYCSVDNYTRPVNGLFQYEPNENGGYTVTRAKGASLDHTLKYKVELVSTIGGVEVRSPKVSFKVIMGKAKPALQESSVSLFAQDKNDRAEFRFNTKNMGLNHVSQVKIKDARYRGLFRIYSYGNGEFAIGFQNGKAGNALAGKRVTVALNVWVEGNQIAGCNTTVKLTVNIVP